jgi:hypothetical protein
MSQAEEVAERLEAVAGKLDALEAKFDRANSAKVERYWWTITPLVAILLLWFSCFGLLFWQLGTWGGVDGKEWEGMVLRAVVVLGALASLTAVTITAMLRNWHSEF